MSQVPSVTVGIPTFNRRPFLAQALQSALAQGDAVSEVLVVNDGSSDDTRSWLEANTDPRVRCIHFDRNRGRPAARDAVVENVQTEFLVWLDDDDVLLEGAVRSHLECLAEFPQSDIVFGNLMICDDDLKATKPLCFKNYSPELLIMHLLYECVVPNPATMIRRSVFDRVGSYDPEYRRAQDYHFWVRAAIAGCQFRHHDHFVCNYRFHEDNSQNPEHLELQSYYQSKIVTFLLGQLPLERLFPVLNWAEQPQEAAAKAMLLVAKVYFDHGDDESALEAVEMSEGFLESQEAAVMKAFICRMMGRAEESADHFANLLAQLQPKFAYLNKPVGALRGSYRVADEARKRKSLQ